MKKILIAICAMLVCISVFGEPKSARTDKFSTMSETWYETKFEEKKIVEYKLLYNTSNTKLSEEVTKYLKAGWNLYGKPAMSQHRVVQAVVRYAE